MDYPFFDMLALPLWIFIIAEAIYSLRTGENHWRSKVRLAIGTVGFIADIFFVTLRPFG